MYRDMTIEDREGLLHTHSQRFANAQFGDLGDQPCTPAEDFALTALAFLLGVAPVLTVLFFALS